MTNLTMDATEKLQVDIPSLSHHSNYGLSSNQSLNDKTQMTDMSKSKQLEENQQEKIHLPKIF